MTGRSVQLDATDDVAHEVPGELRIDADADPSQPLSFDAFARDRLPSLLAYARVLTGDREVAADVVQDVMVRAHGRWSRISATDRPELYVKKMVTNEYLSWRRRWHVRSIISVADDVLHARSPRAADGARQVDDRDDLQQRLAGLPRRQRTILVLRYYEDRDDTEIAELLGIAVGTVRSNVSRALATLRQDAAHLEERR